MAIVLMLILGAPMFAACSSAPPSSGSGATASIMRTWRKVTQTDKTELFPRWDWASGVPVGGTRAESIIPILPGDALAHFVPEFRGEQIRLASAGRPLPSYRVANIGGREVSTCADLLAAVEKTTRSDKQIQVDVVNTGAQPVAPAQAFIVDSLTLSSLAQAVTPEQFVMRTTEGGNPWFVMREDGIRCGVMVRVERSHGLLQLVLSLDSCWGEELFLPREVRATCDNESLRCLTVAEILEILYSDNSLSPANEQSYSFAAVSEKDDFLMPVNYNRLHQETLKSTRKKTSPTASAFAFVAEQPYPGPPILGDARALTGIMLQQTWIRPKDPQRIGWIIFAGPTLRDGGEVAVDVDLGRGPRRFQFAVPSL